MAQYTTCKAGSPLPWCTSMSTMATRGTPCVFSACIAPTATLLKIQKPQLTCCQRQTRVEGFVRKDRELAGAFFHLLPHKTSHAHVFPLILTCICFRFKIHMVHLSVRRVYMQQGCRLTKSDLILTHRLPRKLHAQLSTLPENGDRPKRR